MWSFSKAHEPLVPLVYPGIHPLIEDQVDRAPCDVDRKSVLLYNRHVGIDEHAAVETGDWRSQCQRLGQHRHAAWWPAARDRESDAIGAQSTDGRLGT